MTTDASTPNEAAPAPPPQPQNTKKVGKFVSGVNEGLRAMGDFLLDHPIWLSVVLVVLPVLEILASVLNLPAMIYFAANPPPRGPAEAGHVEAVGMMINASAGIILPLITWLTAMGLVANGLIAKIRDLDDFVRDGHVRLTEERRSILDGFMSELRAGADAIGRAIAKRAYSDIDALVPGWLVVMTDIAIKQQARLLMARLRTAIEQTAEQDRIIARTLMKGLVARFTKLMDHLARDGAFMDPTERREFTNDLSHATKSYHVVYWGVSRMETGPWRWHKEYLTFLKGVATEFGDVTWTFIVDCAEDEQRLPEATKDLTDMGVRCFVFRRGDRAGDWKDYEEFFKSRGPFIELFGTSFDASKPKIDLKAGNITWKSTSVGRRIGSKLEPLTPEQILEIDKTEGVWAADEVDKLIRAGIVNANTSRELDLLSQVHRARQAA